MTLPLTIAPDVRDALARSQAVVALETTLVTHGLPQPEGVDTALKLGEVVRAEGAIPALIGAIGGTLHVGLARADLEALARATQVTKLNLSNLAAIVTSGAPGSTTVAATMLVAHLVGIQVFATGGIGGVHRGSSDTGDISADLTALSRIPVAVVCAGAKAILDLPKTVEALETLGVPVFGFGVDQFPAFYRRESGLPVDARFDDVDALAAAVRMHFALGTGTAVVVANPVPREAEMQPDLYERALADAVDEAYRAGVRGRAVTPFLLERLRIRTEGASVLTNRELLLNNARVAARLAVALANRR